LFLPRPETTLDIRRRQADIASPSFARVSPQRNTSKHGLTKAAKLTFFELIFTELRRYSQPRFQETSLKDLITLGEPVITQAGEKLFDVKH
jgi:hypothetical protein